MKYRITHSTHYRYPDTVHGSLNELRLKPRATKGQRLDGFRMELEPRTRYRSEYLDPFGNPVHLLCVEDDHSEWSVTTVSEVTRFAEEAELPFEAPLPLGKALQALLKDRSEEGLEARCLTQPSPLLPAFPGLLPRLDFAMKPDESVESAGLRLSAFIHTHFRYRPGETEISTPLLQVIEQRVGVCQDFAHLAIACARAMGIPARYVSGYMETLPPEGGERLVGADATHAWFALYDPSQGWLEFDPTNDTVPDGRYITLAWGRDYADVAPIRGVVRGGGESHGLHVSVDVQRVAGDDEMAPAAVLLL